MKYTYPAKIVRVIDGDTVEADLDLGFGIVKRDKLRLYGINAPEARGKEKERGKEATEHLKKLLEKFPLDTIRTMKDKQGKYGRYLAVLHGMRDGCPVDLNFMMVSDGHAEKVSY